MKGSARDLSARKHPFQPQVRGVAQPGRAPGSGPGGRRFESSLPDHLRSISCIGMPLWGPHPLWGILWGPLPVPGSIQHGDRLPLRLEPDVRVAPDHFRTHPSKYVLQRAIRGPTCRYPRNGRVPHVVPATLNAGSFLGRLPGRLPGPDRTIRKRLIGRHPATKLPLLAHQAIALAGKHVVL
jgi:hypothetical protein